MNDNTPVDSKAFIEWSIARHPLAMRREIIEALRSFEQVLRAFAPEGASWLEMLNAYRESRDTPGPRSGIVIAALPAIVSQRAEALDAAFQRLYAFDPEEYVTESLVSLVKSREQAKRSKKAVARRQADASEKAGRIAIVARAVLEKATVDAKKSRSGRVSRIVPTS